MNHYIESLRKLSVAHRSRANMTKMTDMLGNLEETRDELNTWADKAQELNDALDAFADATEQLSEATLPDGATEQIYDLVDKLMRYAPGRDSNVAQFVEYHQAAEQGLEELNDSMQDTNYSAEDRDTMWYEVADQAGNLAAALEELEILGKEPEEDEENS